MSPSCLPTGCPRSEADAYRPAVDATVFYASIAIGGGLATVLILILVLVLRRRRFI